MNLHITDTGTITFLFIDDDRVEQELMKARFKTIGRGDVELVCVPTVELALEVISNSPIAIILLDNRLGPVTDYRETLPQLRSARFTGPIGIVSNNIRDEQIQSFEEFGADFRIAKDEMTRMQYISCFLNTQRIYFLSNAIMIICKRVFRYYGQGSPSIRELANLKVFPTFWV